MKGKQSIALLTCLVSTVLLTGCPGGGGGGGGGNSDPSGGKKPPPPNNGTAPTSLAGLTITVTVTGGNPPFSSTGAYTFTPTSGNGNSGTYSLQGQGGVQSNVGTYTYSANGAIGTLTETEQSGTLVNNTLTFTTSNSGTIYSSSPQGQGPVDVGGNQTGTFTVN